MNAASTDAWTLLSILGLVAITVITRSFFFISSGGPACWGRCWRGWRSTSRCG